MNDSTAVASTPQGRDAVELAGIKLLVRTSYRLQLLLFRLYLRGDQPSVCPALLCNPRRSQVAPKQKLIVLDSWMRSAQIQAGDNDDFRWLKTAN